MQNQNIISLKRILVIALLFMTIGTAMELYLLSHYEDFNQLIPLIILALGLLFALIIIRWPTSLFKRLFKLVLVLMALSGIYGTYLHLQANYEFELEMTPTASGLDLFVESLSGALPALAPASMIVLALLGYSYLILLKQQE